MSRFVLALDQGTTSSRAILFDRDGQPAAVAQAEFRQYFPKPGWVEHDPEEIYATQVDAAKQVLAKAGVTTRDVRAIGITNQRETTVVWERASGRPIYPAIVWQSRQTAPLCQELRDRGLAEDVRNRTGLVIDAYFSATKIRFILDRVEGAAERARRGELAFGTIDSWLIYRLTEGAVHATEGSNASRTMIYNIRENDWDPVLLDAIDVPREILPEVRDSSGDFGETGVLGGPLPIAGVAGDQQAALFGQGCFAPGSAKNTYGTGCFFLSQTGERAPHSENGLVTTIAWCLEGRVSYALEGSVFVAGAAIQWLRDELGILESAAESETLARSVPDTGGVVLVPAFAGLGAPHWDETARGLLIGLTRGTSRAHIVRAALESLAYQSRDMIRCAESDSGESVASLRVDGGACENDFLMQFQADILGVPVERPRNLEVTAFGAAALAGLATGFYSDRNALTETARAGARTFDPSLPESERSALVERWGRAVERARGWETL